MPWLLVQSGAGEAAWNMAFDEALLEAAPRLGRPVLRFYSWTQPAASFGYSQHFRDVAQLTPLRPLVRRSTGGGLVPHGADWTYSLVFPPSHAWHALRAAESYRQLHAWLKASFARLRVDTELAARARKESPGQCFAGPEQADLLWRGRKIAGAAQRRTKAGLLIQGSIQPQPEGIAKIDWQQAVCDEAGERFHARWEPLERDPAIWERAEELARGKYSKDEYTRRR